MVREVDQRDLDAILELYLFLHQDSIPEKMSIWYVRIDGCVITVNASSYTT